MYKGKVHVYAEEFYENEALPRNTSKTSDVILQAGGTMGALQITCQAAGAVALAASSSISLEVMDDAAEDGSFATQAVQASKTFSKAASFGTGDVILSCVLPLEAKNFIKVKLSTTDTAASGNVNVFAEYLPR